MKTSTRRIVRLLSAAVLCSGLAACGGGLDNGGGGTTTPTQPTTVVTATGAVVTDSWGYTGAGAALLTAPAKTVVTIAGHTLLVDGLNVVVSGTIPSSVSYSVDGTTLPAAGQSSQPGTFVSYLNIGIGPARTAQPALSASIDVGASAAGQTMNVYRYDSGTGKWVSPQAAVVTGAGQVDFSIGVFGLYAVFK